MSEIAIRTENLTRDFGALRAVDSLSIEVPAGIVFGFLGPNGAGKTTTIYLLLGLIEATSGRAEVLGFDAGSQADEIRLRTGALLEHPGIYERLSAEDNLEFYARVWRMPAGERKARIKEALGDLGLWERRREFAGTWSRGMKQKLAVARALLHRPALLFLDEPTAGFDPRSAAALHEDLAALTDRKGVTVFINTHNLAEAEELCSQVGVIREGKLLAVGPPTSLSCRGENPSVEIRGRGFTSAVLTRLRSRPEVASAKTRDDQLLISLRKESPIAPLVRLLVDSGAELEEVRKVKTSLEEIFLRLTEEEP